MCFEAWRTTTKCSFRLVDLILKMKGKNENKFNYCMHRQKLLREKLSSEVNLCNSKGAAGGGVNQLSTTLQIIQALALFTDARLSSRPTQTGNWRRYM
jgi:hypothetical protein